MGKLKADTSALSGAGAAIKQVGDDFGVIAGAVESSLENVVDTVTYPGLASALSSLAQSGRPIHRATYEGVRDLGSNVSSGSTAYQSVDQQLAKPEGPTK